MLTILEKVIFLQNVEVFADIPTEELSFLAAIAGELSYQEGDTIFREKDPAHALYLVVEGSVRLHRGKREIYVAGEKDSFGTWALFDNEPRVVTATVLTDTQVLQIAREDFYDLLSDHIRITQAVFTTLVKRLRKLLERVGIEGLMREEE